MRRRNYTPYLPPVEQAYTVSGIKFRTYTSDFETEDDLYKSKAEAEERAYNIGCAGYRKVITDALGSQLYGPCSDLNTYTNITKSIKPNSMPRKYYQFDPTENIYDVRDSINDTAKSGFDYKNQIFEKTLSNVMFRDPQKTAILANMQRVVFALIESVKQIKNFFNYTVPFNNKRVF
jgi:hypothetical protein